MFKDFVFVKPLVLPPIPFRARTQNHTHPPRAFRLCRVRLYHGCTLQRASFQKHFKKILFRTLKRLTKYRAFKARGFIKPSVLRLILVAAADKDSKNRPLNLGLLVHGLLVLGLLGLLSLRLRGLFGGVVVDGRFLLTNRTVHRVVESIFVSERTNKRQHHSGTCWMEKPSSVLELL